MFVGSLPANVASMPLVRLIWTVTGGTDWEESIKTMKVI